MATSRPLVLLMRPFALSDVIQDLKKRRQDNLWWALREKYLTERSLRLESKEDAAS